MNLPNSPVAERGVLGCILLDIPAGVQAVRDRAGHGSPLFHDPQHLTIWQACAKLVGRNNGRSDLPHLVEAMEQAGTLDRIGGYPTLSAMLRRERLHIAALFLPHTEIARFPSVASIWEREADRSAAGGAG